MNRTKSRVIALAAGIVLAVALPMPAGAGGVGRVVVAHQGGVTVVAPDERGQLVLDTTRAVASPDGTIVATAKFTGGRTQLDVVRSFDASRLWSQTLDGDWRPEAVAKDGSRTLLGDPGVSPDPYTVPSGRATTRLLLATATAVRPMTLPGNLQAEAFASDMQSAVLIEHLPALAPTQYRVRNFILEPGVFGDPIGSNKQPLPIEQMRGVRLDHAWAADAGELYTLYDASTPEADRVVFVHDLNLRVFGARCLAVPEEIDAGSGRGAITVAGTDLIVVGKRGIARINTFTGDVERSVRFTTRGQPTVAAKPAGVFVASGTTLSEFRTFDLSLVATYRLPAAATAITVMPYGLVLVLDVRGRLWLVGPGLAEPILRGRLPSPAGRFPHLYTGAAAAG